MKTFFINFIDEGNCEINKIPKQIESTDLSQAITKSQALQVPKDAVEVRIFQTDI